MAHQSLESTVGNSLKTLTLALSTFRMANRLAFVRLAVPRELSGKLYRNPCGPACCEFPAALVTPKQLPDGVCCVSGANPRQARFRVPLKNRSRGNAKAHRLTCGSGSGGGGGGGGGEVVCFSFP